MWNMELKLGYTEEEYYELFPAFLRVIKPIKLRYLQYRILTHSLTTNVKRHKWNQEISDLCTFCKNSKENDD